MHESLPNQYIAFNGMQHIATGTLVDVATEIKRVVDSGQHRSILLFDAKTSELLDIDTRGTIEDVAQRYAADVEAAPRDDTPAAETVADGPRARGRPKLGVVAREVTLLPRHWDWLSGQPGGASVALRKLVEEARRANAGRDVARKSREAAYKFMSAIASSLETFEEATRALFAGDRPRFETLLSSWPTDVRNHTSMLAQGSFN